MTPHELAEIVEKAFRIGDYTREDDWLDAVRAAEVALEVLVALAAGRTAQIVQTSYMPKERSV